MLFPRIVQNIDDLEDNNLQQDNEMVFVVDSGGLWIFYEGRWRGVFHNELQDVIDNNELRLDALESNSTTVNTVESVSTHTLNYNTSPTGTVTTSDEVPHIRINNDSVNDINYTAIAGDSTAAGLINSHETVIIELSDKGLTTITVAPYNTSVVDNNPLIQIEAI